MSEWRTPEELVEIGFGRSRVVMMNEAHNGMLRCIRTREVGRRALPVAHGCGVSHLALEALPHDGPAAGGYLDQPDMRALIENATPLLVWCGNGHLVKFADGGWTPMGMRFRELTGIDHFALDQSWTVLDDSGLAEDLRADLEPLGGTAGMPSEELPPPFCRPNVDALLFSVDNELV